MTPAYGSSIPHGLMPSFPHWHCKESADTMEMKKIMHPSTRPKQTADFRADATSAENASHVNW